jgi:endoglucanase
VTNAVGGSTTAQVTVVVSLPTITSFDASPNPVNSGDSVTLTAVFSGGTGTVDQGIGAVTSGVGTSTGPISADTTYTLTVTNAVGGSTTAWVTVMLPTTNLAVWVLGKPTGSTGQITLSLRIDNKTTQAVDMSTVTLRYWYQDEGLGTNLVLTPNSVSIGYSSQGKVTSGTAVANPSPVAGADHYLELAFSGTLAAQGDKATNDQFNIQVTLHTAGYTGAVDVTNDYSYDDGAALLYEQKITLHDQSGNVIWGTPPG